MKIEELPKELYDTVLFMEQAVCVEGEKFGDVGGTYTGQRWKIDIAVAEKYQPLVSRWFSDGGYTVSFSSDHTLIEYRYVAM